MINHEFSCSDQLRRQWRLETKPYRISRNSALRAVVKGARLLSFAGVQRVRIAARSG
jgi:hypothetical protein